MAEEININDRRDTDHGNGATTALVAVVLILLIGIAFYFGFVRGNWGGNAVPNDVNVELNVPDVGGGSGAGGGAQ